MRKIFILLLGCIVLYGCIFDRESDVASRNLSYKADNFGDGSDEKNNCNG
jgi:hypothetical protein